MVIAAPVYKDLVAPFFDTSTSLVVVDLKGTENISRVITGIDDLSPTEKAILIKELGPDIFVCDALSGFWYQYLVSNGINVYPFIKGRIDDILGLVRRKKLKKCPFPGIPPEK